MKIHFAQSFNNNTLGNI